MSWNKDKHPSSGVDQKPNSRETSRANGANWRHTTKGFLLSGNLFFVLLAVGMAFGLATAFMDATASVPQTTLKTTNDTPAANAPQQQPGLKVQPKDTVATIPQASDSNLATSATPVTPAPCDTDAKQVAAKKRQLAIKVERAKHREVMFKLQSTGALTRFLNSNSYNSRVDDEASRHTSAVAAIDRIYREELAAASCQS